MTTEEEIQYNTKLASLKQDWHSLRYRHLGREQLQDMMYATPLSRLLRRSWKENFAFGGKLLLTVIVMITVNAFGSVHTPIPALWAAMLLIDDYIGFRYLYFLPPADSVLLTLRGLHGALRRLRVKYTLAHVVVWAVITLLSPVMFNQPGAWITAIALIPVLALVCLLTWRIWTRRIEEVEKRIAWFNE